MRWLLRLAVVGAALAAAVWVFVPTEPVDLTAGFDPASIGDDVDAYLAAQEANVPDLREGAEKRVVWAGEPGAKTPLAFVYIHGFSASSEELRPVPDAVAAHFESNLFFTRLAGHGRIGAAMAEAVVNDWVNDVAEAMAIGRQIGDRVVLIGTSGGGSLAALTALDPDLSEDLAGVVLISPGFRLRAQGAGLLTLPGARSFVPRMAGDVRSFTPVNEDHARYWTSEYPTVAVLPLAALVKAANSADLGKATVPALFILSDADSVVDPTATRDAAARWGGPRQIVPVALGPDDDPGHHVIAGDILSPGQTENVVRRIIVWAMEL